MKQGDTVTFQNEEGKTIRGKIKNVYKNICASIEELNKNSHIISLSELKKAHEPVQFDTVRFHHNNKWYEGRVMSIEHNLAHVIGEYFELYVLLNDLTVI
jgi:hypothetical protein